MSRLFYIIYKPDRDQNTVKKEDKEHKSIKYLAKEFTSKIFSNKFSPTEIQSFLVKNKYSPVNTVINIEK